MRRTRNPVKTITEREARIKNIDLESGPSAGPHANITGMRKLYWGIDAPILQVGVYVYKVSQSDYDKA